MLKNILTSVLSALIVVGLAFGFHSPAPLGNRVETTLNEFGKGLQLTDANLGTRGTILKMIKTGTCTLITYGTISATSTGSVDCAITGVRPGDLVDLNLAASTTLASQYAVKSSQASSTAGYATAQLINLTGAAANPAATNGFGSSTVYKIWRVSNTF